MLYVLMYEAHFWSSWICRFRQVIFLKIHTLYQAERGQQPCFLLWNLYQMLIYFNIFE